ncbi:MAG TPA: HlyD family efflux transporter periplasmic adaptor subunit, partial [Terriglobia bacterium]|nr:HlyD family efflux transporter periplasmic adaptor subunit [Terriglobia bacterium]
MPDPSRSIFQRTIAEPARPPAPARPAIGPPEAPPPAPRPRILAFFLIGLIALGVVVWALAGRHAARTGERASEAAPGTATVERRDFVRTVRLTGTTEAVESRAIVVPRLTGQQFSELVITKLVHAGARVKQGDILVEFDRQNQIKAFLDKQAEYRDLVDQVAKKQADEAAAKAKDETELKQAEDDYKKAQLEMSKNEIIARIDAEKNRETLEETEANLKALRETFDLKRRAALADIRVLELQRDRSKETMLHAQRNEEELSVRSPMDGTVVLNTIWKSGRFDEVQEGDQARSGQSIMQVIDPSAMQIHVRVNQTDLLGLAPGAEAQVRLDAYPGMTFHATLNELDPIGTSSEFSGTVRTFAARFSIRGSDPKL